VPCVSRSLFNHVDQDPPHGHDPLPGAETKHDAVPIGTSLLWKEPPSGGSTRFWVCILLSSGSTRTPNGSGVDDLARRPTGHGLVAAKGRALQHPS
jgi:hypothetical protein